MVGTLASIGPSKRAALHGRLGKEQGESQRGEAYGK